MGYIFNRITTNNLLITTQWFSNRELWQLAAVPEEGPQGALEWLLAEVISRLRHCWKEGGMYLTYIWPLNASRADW